MGAHQARAFALKYFRRNSTVLINGHLGMEEDVGRTGSTACHWCLIPFKLLQTGPAFTLLAEACAVFAWLLPHSKESAAAFGHLELVRKSGSQALTGQWTPNLHFDKIPGEGAHTESVMWTLPTSRATDSCFSTTFSCTKQGSRRNAPAYSSCHSFQPNSCLLFSNSNDV